MSLSPRRRPLAAALVLLAAAGACAPRQRPAPAPVPVVAPATATRVLGAAPAPARAAADATAAPAAAPARTFPHTPGVTWDLDVLPYEGHERVQRYIALFTGSARGRFTEWLSRGTRYDTMVRAKLRAGGLPEDLYYLALVESGYEPNAVSHAGAVGMWQFMAPTARDVGLRVDWWVDERRDPVRATDAAVRMMRWLRREFGSLFVAAAAYNGGPGRVSRGITQLAANDAEAAANAAAAAALAAFDTANAAAANAAAVNAAAATPAAGPFPAAAPRAVGDARFFALAEAGVLRSETVNYVPQLIAAALVAKEAARYGLRVEERDDLAYDEVRVPALTPLAAVAEVTGSTRAELLELNPHVLRGMTPPGGASVVRVPEGAGEGAADDLAELDDSVRRPFRRVVTRRRDTWVALAERADVPAAVLRAYNPRLETVSRGKNRGRIVGNQAVRVPTAAVMAYARAGSWEGTAPGALPAMPAPPPEPKPEPKPAAKPKAAPNTAAKPDATSDAKPAAKADAKSAPKPAARAGADSASPAPDSAVYRALRVGKDAGDPAPAGAKPARPRNAPPEARSKPDTAKKAAAKPPASKTSAGETSAGKTSAEPATKPSSKSLSKPAADEVPAAKPRTPNARPRAPRQATR